MYVITAPTAGEAKRRYIYFFGFTWRERTKGVECQKVQVVK